MNSTKNIHNELLEPSENSFLSGEKFSLDCVSLFSGIGGFEYGFFQHGIKTTLMCEIDPIARSVLRDKYANAALVEDVRTFQDFGSPDVVCAGFPCQDLSQSGKTMGIEGEQSSVISELFRLIADTGRRPSWVILENVPFMLNLDRGKAMEFLVYSLEKLGYRWAYRVIDARYFGIPQRRKRVFIVASNSEDPKDVLLSEDSQGTDSPEDTATNFGFYWSEGNTGVGWAVESIPPLKVSSGMNIPTPPGIWDRERRIFFTPHIKDAERLMGFPVDWTEKAGKDGKRLKLLGNSINTSITSWLAEKICTPIPYDATKDTFKSPNGKWPKAAWGKDGEVFVSKAGEAPRQSESTKLSEFLRFTPKPLSERASSGFFHRAKRSTLNFQEGFLEDLEYYISRF